MVEWDTECYSTNEIKGVNKALDLTRKKDCVKEIDKVIVSNEQNDKKSTPLSVVKEQSTVFIEMDVREGFAVHKRKLPHADVGSFSFRGLNSDGEIVSFD